MTDSYNQAVKIMEKIKPFVALIVLVFIVLGVIGLLNYNKLQKDIKDNCGYKQSEKVYCVCDKSFVSQTFTLTNPYFNSSSSNIINLTEINLKN